MFDPRLQSEILAYLWSEHQKNSNLSYDIAPVCAKYKSDALMVSNGMRLEGLIKDDVLVDGESVRCTIAMKGALSVDKKSVEELIDRALSGMRGVNSIGNVMQILQLGPKDFQLVFDLANEMQNRDLVKLLYAFQPGGVVNVEMTLEGVRRKR